MNKLVIGTVQFGLDYGINNFRGKVPENEVFEILDYASQNNINFLDTSHAYGDSESILGEYIEKNRGNFKIISKLPKHDLINSFKVFSDSLSKLKVDKIYGYLIHHFDFFIEKPQIWEDLKQIKVEGKVEKIGFSLYYPHELDYLLEKNIDFDIIQIPYNIFDQRFSPHFINLKRKNIEIHTRSVFLQGLVFIPARKLPEKFLKIKSKLENLNRLSNMLNTSIASLCLNFSILNPLIDKIIIGIDCKEHLNEIINTMKETDNIKSIYHNLEILKENDENIILPTNWK